MVIYANEIMSVMHGKYVRIVNYCRVTQQTQNIFATFIQRRPNTFDAGPTLYKCYANVWCLLGSDFVIS